jgi:4'-phosphopantetheinyl transferase
MGGIDLFPENSARTQSRPLNDEVHFWCASLNSSGPLIDALNQLSDEERQRAGRFRSQADCKRFALSRVALRAILGRYFDIDPIAVRFSYGTFGKPELAKPYDGELRFSVSRSQDVAVYAVSPGGQVGIDVERLDESVEADQLAERFFAPAESAHIRGLPPEEKASAFLNYWVSKEAYVKATGLGLNLPLNSFEVSLSGRPRLIGSDLDRGCRSRWSLHL